MRSCQWRRPKAYKNTRPTKTRRAQRTARSVKVAASCLVLKNHGSSPDRLVSASGDTDLRRKPFAVFFDFTRCPEVCPTTLWEMTEALKSLGSDAGKLRVQFISVDPRRDTPEFMACYLQSFDKHITGLMGAENEVATVGKEYYVYFRKVAAEDGDYTMDHTAKIFMMDAEGSIHRDDQLRGGYGDAAAKAAQAHSGTA